MIIKWRVFKQEKKLGSIDKLYTKSNGGRDNRGENLKA